MSVEEENKALINRVTEALDRGDLGAFDELFTPELAQDVKEDIAEIKRAFPDYHGTEVIQIAEGDFVASRIMFYGTRSAETAASVYIAATRRSAVLFCSSRRLAASIQPNSPTWGVVEKARANAATRASTRRCAGRLSR
jgi:hypothetical protein